MSLDLTRLDPALKQYYMEVGVPNLASQGRPAFALLKKDTKAGGRNFPIPVRYTNPQGTSHTYATALQNAAASEFEDYVVGYKRLYTPVNIDCLALKGSKSLKHAFESAVEEINAGMDEHMDVLSKKIFRTTGGSIGRVGSITEGANNYLTLSSVGDAYNFKKGQVLKADTVDGGGTVHAGSATVTAVDLDNGRVYFGASSPTGSITGLAEDDYLFVDGDYDNSLAGFAAWIPDEAPSSGDSFFGVDRSADPVRLAGSRLAAGGLPVEEALIRMSNKLSKNNSKPDVAVMSFEKYRDLTLELEGRIRYADVKLGPAKIGFKGIEVIGRDGPIVCLPDNGCPQERSYMLDSKTWTFVSVDDAPHIKSDDGSKFFRLLTEDAFQTQIITYGNLGCLAPFKNGVIKFDE